MKTRLLYLNRVRLPYHRYKQWVVKSEHIQRFDEKVYVSLVLFYVEDFLER